VWPGEWSSHLFVIDDFDQYARAMGLIHDAERSGLADRDHDVRWEVSRYEVITQVGASRPPRVP